MLLQQRHGVEVKDNADFRSKIKDRDMNLLCPLIDHWNYFLPTQ